jgi:transcription antitermination protein NusB
MTPEEPRDLALKRLYEIDTRPEAIPVEDLTDRAARMVTGVTTQRESLDHQIESASEHWSVARMPVVDRAILRLALWELENEPGTPTAVILSEAVRLAETYSTARSSSFVNGVLSALAKSVRTT